ncbi:hypothetical protein GCM10011385_31460 [Nitratireductor aestuarii]|uniref:Acyl-CoA dehydrogenase/oxidase C-terminal domain-containing protein n=1 Tax=Nitratireductor aestuarii TaxID=1735103 RepID=A0A916S093_9HYPH|nr:acyl-CoA dehydrogenase family protein [Nitratireductor aestuarii]GGA75143.1 hypothetical protein GCM10011385_31460 [Nitratireductor aestuarii]
MSDDSLRPEDFAEAAGAAITDAEGKSFAEKTAVLAENGLFGVIVAEEQGGLGLDLSFGIPIVAVAGKLQLRYPLVEQMLVASALAGEDIGAAIVGGEKTAAIAWQGSLEEGYATHATFVADADYVLVASGEGAALLDRASGEVQEDPSLDPDYPQYTLKLEGAATVATLSAEAFAKLKFKAKVLYGAFAAGAGEGAMDRAASHMAGRVQFGRPLSAKQAVRHTMARMKLLTETSYAGLQRAIAQDEFGAARDVDTAFAGAIGNSCFIIEKAIHLHGGMGFTWELPLHCSLRDVRKIDAAFNTGGVVKSIGKAFIAAA